MGFCTNCGKQLTVNAAFCSGCGTKLQSRTPVPQMAPSRESTGHPLTGTLLIAGDGKYNLSKLIYWFFSLVGDVALLVVGLGVLPELIDEARRRRAQLQFFGHNISITEAETIANIMVVIGVVGLVVGIIFATLALRRYQSRINVYDYFITGKTVVGFPPTSHEFNIPMSDVRNIDVLKGTGIVLHTHYATYTCYTKKADEIRNVILSNLNYL